MFSEKRQEMQEKYGHGWNKMKSRTNVEECSPVSERCKKEDLMQMKRYGYNKFIAMNGILELLCYFLKIL